MKILIEIKENDELTEQQVLNVLQAIKDGETLVWDFDSQKELFALGDIEYHTIPEKIIVVTSGEYSDYTVHAVYMDQDKLEEDYPYGRYDHKEFMLNMPESEFKVWEVELDMAVGDVLSCSHSWDDSISIWKKEHTGINNPYGHFETYVYSNDAKTAIKVAKERLLQFKVDEAVRNKQIEIDRKDKEIRRQNQNTLEYLVSDAIGKETIPEDKLYELGFELDGVDTKLLWVDAGVRYWEDAEVNGVQDSDGHFIPCRSGERWQPIINIDNGQILNWKLGTTADIHYKVCDDGIYKITDSRGWFLTDKEGYVPNMLSPGGQGYGDYIIMKINEDGFIEGWNGTNLKEFNI